MENIGKKKRTGLVVMLVVGMLFAVSSGLVPHLHQDTQTEEWQVIWKGNIATAAESTPASGATAFLEIFAINHSASPGTDYARNTSSDFETWCDANGLGYANADEFNEEIASEVSFDFLVRARFNKTHCWDGSKFIDTRCRIKMTVTSDDWLDGENIADVEGTLVVSYNNSGANFIWVNCYWDADDTNGYQLSDDGTITVSEISIEAKF